MWLSGWTSLVSMSWPSTSTVTPTSTSNDRPLRSLASASFIVLNVVTCTLQLYFLAKAFTTSWLM